jgi:hypothetical protein
METMTNAALANTASTRRARRIAGRVFDMGARLSNLSSEAGGTHAAGRLIHNGLDTRVGL